MFRPMCVACTVLSIGCQCRAICERLPLPCDAEKDKGGVRSETVLLLEFGWILDVSWESSLN